MPPARKKQKIDPTQLSLAGCWELRSEESAPSTSPHTSKSTKQKLRNFNEKWLTINFIRGFAMKMVMPKRALICIVHFAQTGTK